MFRTQRDVTINLDIYKTVPILWREDPESNPWGLLFMQGLFNMASDSNLFDTKEDLTQADWTLAGNVFIRDTERMMPLYEAKMIHHFDHRFGDYRTAKVTEGKGVRQLPRLQPSQYMDPEHTVLPRYWVSEVTVRNALADRWDREWFLGWRDVTSGVDERTMICSVLPWVAVGHKLPLALPTQDADLLYACWSSFAFDYIARQKVAGTSMAFFILKQLPVPPPNIFARSAPWSGGSRFDIWIRKRVLELTYTAFEMAPFAQDLGDEGPPFRWDEPRRFAMRTELDAAFFHLYAIGRDDVDHIMETFPIVKRKDIERYGSFRTKESIMQVYDAMADAGRTGRPYETILDPPPGQGPRHPAKGSMH
jgi:hypothetical protein